MVNPAFFSLARTLGLLVFPLVVGSYLYFVLVPNSYSCTLGDLFLICTLG
jgi:hypothetical protein